MTDSKVNPSEVSLGRRRDLRGRFRFDLGVRRLLPEWRKLFTREHLRSDALAGLTVACVAVPLSLAIALASGVPPAVGLVTAIIGGIVCALFGGTPLAVSGPAAAMAILVASIVETHGVTGLLITVLGCGVLQLVTGVTGLGRLVRYVPVPVIAGFTAGIGAIILIGQLPRALGLPAPDQSHVFHVIAHIGDEIRQVHPVAFGLALSSVTICLVLPRLWPRVPALLAAVILPTLAVALFQLEVPAVGEMPRALPMPRLPNLPSLGSLGALVGATFMVYGLASLETLLSSTAVDKLSGSPRHDADQELIGQGLGNVASALFGGLPVTGVIARSALNLQAGAKTRRAALLHALVLIVMVGVLTPVISRIPLAALAGILIAVALRMLNVGEFLHLLRTSRTEGLIYAITFLVIVLGDLIAGVQAGVGAALLIAAIRLGQTQVRLQQYERRPTRLSLGGPLTFLSTRSLDPLRQTLAAGTAHEELIVDLKAVTVLDISGAEMLAGLVTQLEARGTRVAILGLRPELERILRGSDPDGHIMAMVVRSETAARELLGVEPPRSRPMDRLVSGVERFREGMSERYQALFESLSSRQSPHTLFITCSDSRIVPNLITSMDPGELFIVRNVGNIIPPFSADGLPAEGAAVEFAVGILGVTEIVVCGHSGCGAMKALLSGIPPEFPSLTKWLDSARSVRVLGENPSPDTAAQLNALLQLEHLLTYPVVRSGVAAGVIHLHGWYYDIHGNHIFEWNDDQSEFVPLALHPAPSSGAELRT